MKTLKYSRQRESIKRCLMSRSDHPTADMVYADIKKEYPNVSLGTVYRNLNLLVELKEASRLVIDGKNDRFDADTSPHYHFICRCCGAVSDLPMMRLHDVERLASVYTNGEIEEHTMLFYGRCENCTKKETNKIS
ncbi:MAG: transcriptional repressor [bacterium]|nr:transcriptional repressor [bacterium]